MNFEAIVCDQGSSLVRLFGQANENLNMNNRTDEEDNYELVEDETCLPVRNIPRSSILQEIVMKLTRIIKNYNSKKCNFQAVKSHGRDYSINDLSCFPL